MYSQANERVESVLRPPTRALPSVIVDTEKVLREAEGPTKAHGPEASNAWWVERCSPRGAPQNQTVRAGRSPKSTSGSKDVGRYSSFCIISGHMSSEKC